MPAAFLRAEAGFTILEVVVAFSILAILSGLAIPVYSQYIASTRVKRCMAEIRGIESAIAAYSTSNEVLPNSLADIKMDGVMDPWGNPYQYLNIADGDIKGKGKLRKDRFLNPLNTDYDLYSMGVDGQSQTPLTAKVSQDDVLRASNGAYVGLASDF